MSKFKTGIFAAALILGLATNSSANVKQLKTYREVYPDYKPQCGYCHVEEKPKKEEGKNELNAYGLKLKEAMGDNALTAEMVQSVGNHEDFLAEEGDASETTTENAEDTKPQQESEIK